MAVTDGLRITGINLTRFNRAALDAVGTGVVWKATQRAGRRAVKYAREELDKAGTTDTGALRDSLDIKMEVTARGPAFTLYSKLPNVPGHDVSYAAFVNSGTAGNGSGYIYPTTAPMLRFNPGKRSGGPARSRGGQFATMYVYAPRVRGQKGTEFMNKALARIRVTDFS